MRISKEDSTGCHLYPAAQDDARHTPFECSAWNHEREAMDLALRGLDQYSLIEKNFADINCWNAVEEFTDAILRVKEDAERTRGVHPI